ncbi:MAG: hypothetical protein JWM07_857 [Candidatus Saccharibacteria bacterium]|nr:hypothetical protein [Candidatus Saccharibacteria bacterium]
MDIYRHKFTRVTVLILVAAAALVVLRRYRQKKQVDPQTDNQQGTTDDSSVNVEDTKGFLIDNHIDHEQYMKLFNSYQLEFTISQQENQPIGPLLKERLNSLNDLIVHQLELDQKWLSHLSFRESQLIADRHRKWEEIQTRIKQMIDSASGE